MLYHLEFRDVVRFEKPQVVIHAMKEPTIQTARTNGLHSMALTPGEL